jgi:hypothetical protein
MVHSYRGYNWTPATAAYQRHYQTYFRGTCAIAVATSGTTGAVGQAIVTPFEKGAYAEFSIAATTDISDDFTTAI